jgi:predicted ATPase
MRISRIEIEKWRNLEKVSFDVADDSSLVCLVGENGTGKSNILELIAGAAQHFGLVNGYDSLRGPPLSGDCDLSITLLLPKDPGAFFGAGWQSFALVGQGWTGRVTAQFKTGINPSYSFEGCDSQKAKEHFKQLRQLLAGKADIRYLLLDANRAYPEVNVDQHRVGEIASRDWEGAEWKNNRSFLRTSALYSDWIDYLQAKETQAADKWMEDSRSASEAGQPQPVWKDHFENYRLSLSQVLPHLKFKKVDRTMRAAVFDSAGNSLRFHQLSGGERELAFMIGQVSRFGLQRGLFLVDEPELHLNPELVRLWITWLRNTMVDGQTWLATHSLEAAEVAGASNVFVLARAPAPNPARTVKSIRSLSNLPVLQTLAGAVGSPAFSIAQHKFVWIEGEPAGGEKSRYYALFGHDKALRFLEAGNCHEVGRKYAALKEVSAVSGQPIRTAGIVDRDFQSPERVAALTAAGLIVLPCHEVENLFLDPKILLRVGKTLGVEFKAEDALVSAGDEVAGMWIFQHACASADFANLDLKAAKGTLSARDWSGILADGEAQVVKNVVALVLGPAAVIIQFSSALKKSIQEYAAERAKPDFWLRCMGKQVLTRIPKSMGLTSTVTLVHAIAAAWAATPELRSAPQLNVETALGLL